MSADLISFRSDASLGIECGRGVSAARPGSLTAPQFPCALASPLSAQPRAVAGFPWLATVRNHVLSSPGDWALIRAVAWLLRQLVAARPFKFAKREKFQLLPVDTFDFQFGNDPYVFPDAVGLIGDLKFVRENGFVRHVFNMNERSLNEHAQHGKFCTQEGTRHV